MTFKETFTPTGLFPIDTRILIKDKSLLYNANNWFSPVGKKNWMLYRGLVVSVAPPNAIDPSLEAVELYMCVDATKPGKNDQNEYLPIPEDHWRKISPIEWNDEIEPIQSEPEETQENILNNSDGQNSGSESDNSISQSSTE